jgi:hypothetical protein
VTIAVEIALALKLVCARPPRSGFGMAEFSPRIVCRQLVESRHVTQRQAMKALRCCRRWFAS